MLTLKIVPLAGARSAQKSSHTGHTPPGMAGMRLCLGLWIYSPALCPHPLELDLLMCRPSGFPPTLFLSSEANKDFTAP